MRPALRPGLLPLWRDRDTIQIGVDPRRAVALTGVGAAAGMIGLLDGSRDRVQVVAAAAELGIPPAVAERMLALLAAAGALIDFPAGLIRDLPADLRSVQLSELAAASLASGDGDGGAHVFARRAGVTVRICGTGRVPAALADLLAAAGVVTETAPVLGGESPVPRQGTPPDLTVLHGYHAPEVADSLRRDQVTHLATFAAEAIGIVGPLVRPGATACMRCLDLARTERDPAWPLIRAQLSRRAQPEACNAILVAAVAAQAAGQVLQVIDHRSQPNPCDNATLELVQPDWRWLRRAWPAHGACTCLASSREAVVA